MSGLFYYNDDMEGLKDMLLAKKGRQRPNKNLHSDIHALADEISVYFGERSRFGMYLGAVKRLGVARTRAIFSEVKQSTAREPRKLFFWKTRAAAKAEGATPKPRPRKTTKPRRKGVQLSLIDAAKAK